MKQTKSRVMVLYGGCSSEHEISILSASAVIAHLDPQVYDVIPLGIDKQGRWWLNDLADIELTSKTLCVRSLHAQAINPLTFLKKTDIVFPVIHGNVGEDGILQGLLELTGAAYVGAGVLASAVAMDKDITKRLVSQASLPIAPYICFDQGQWLTQPGFWEQQVKQQLTYPVFVKPANTGSSIGISKVHASAALAQAINQALQFDSKVLVEQSIDAREIEIAVLEHHHYGQAPLVSVPGELTTTHEFYSYQAKYCDEDNLTLTVPANLSADIINQLQTVAQKIFSLLNCQGMARIDFFIDKHSEKIYFNELNTIPGFTPVSMYPMMWQASGLPYQELLDKLIVLAVARQQRKQLLKRDVSDTFDKVE
ncbi:MAG: D-alanine--D-alanine ligase [Gammaproteobacteria bacterium]|nr:D-alanine--D-alanine ligase [Gammaproteobacteria bacterium]